MFSVCSCHGLVIGLLIAAAAIPLPGCDRGTDRAAAEGVVRVDGEPLEKGAINFVPANAALGPSAGAEIVAGRYTLAGPKGPVPGKYRVEIVATRKTGQRVPDLLRPGQTTDAIEQYIPDRYNFHSRLEVELHAGENRDVDFDVRIGR